MKTKNNIQDKVIKKLIIKADLDKPSHEFTGKVMNNIRAVHNLETEISQPLLSNNMWLLIAFSGIILIGFLIFFDFSFIDNIFQNVTINKTMFIPFFESIVNSFRDLFGSVKLSTISLIILISICSLVIIDRIVKKTKTSDTYMV